MSVIQQIQEKYAKLMAIIIALALIIFVVMLAFENGGSLFRGGNGTSVGKVNGKSIEQAEFANMVEQQKNYMIQQGYPQSEALTQQAVSNAWNMEVNRILLETEMKKLGMQIGKKELGDILYGANPPADLRQRFSDPETGVYNAQAAKQAIDNMLKTADAKSKEQFNLYLNSLENMRLEEKYTSLLNNSINFPRWLIEKQNEDNSLMARVSFVKEFYSNVADTAVKVTDKEIEEYVAKHKSEFKQEESRSIAYVAFSALPTGEDSAAVLKSIVDLKPEFDTTADAGSFVLRNGSSLEYSDSYFPKSQLTMANMQMGLSFKDTILSLAKNAVYGPYLDGNSYVLAKMLDSKVLPDSVKCRHILISTNEQQGGFADSTAKRKIDSIEAAIKGGASWATLAASYNPDGTRTTAGEMTFSSTQIQSEGFAPEFGQFILFDGKPGESKVVKTSFGYHYINIMSFIKPEQHYKIAYFARAIEASQETDNNANNLANKFAADSRDAKSFDASAEKLKAQGINKLIATDIPPTGSQIVGLGVSRNFVKEIYAADKGDVLAPERVGDNWVVAMVTDVQKEGTMPAAKARYMVEPLLLKHKKAELIAKKIGTITTLEAAAAALGGRNIETADSLRFAGVRPASLSSETRVIGAAFNMQNKGKVVPQALEGAEGVYVLRVDDISATANTDSNVAEQRKAQYQQAKMRGSYPPLALREAATIKNNLSKMY
ncbi:MAG: SurA N-terminal domain-containing protein [Chitinophagaceae bacterium]|nr:SurA N-terminal domain-containing protein [Chitinophagaceae bacterium]